MSKITLESAMNATNVTKEDLDRLVDSAKAALKEFEKQSQEQREKDFVRLLSADATVHKLHEAFTKAPRDKVIGLLDKEDNDLFREIITILGCFALIGAHCGFMKEADDESEAD